MKRKSNGRAAVCTKLRNAPIMLCPFIRAHRPPYRTVRIKAGGQILTAADPLPDDHRDAIAMIGRGHAH